MTSTDLRTPAVLAIIAAVSAVIAWRYPDSWPQLGRFIAIAIFFSAGFFAIAGAADYAVDRVMIYYRRWKDAQAITPDAEVLRRFGELQPWQAEALMNRYPAAVAVPGVAGATAVYKIADDEIPATFVWEYFNHSTDKHLYPIRRYGSGSIEQRYAEILTEYFIRNRLADPAHGNQPASWRYGKARAEGWFRLREA